MSSTRPWRARGASTAAAARGCRRPSRAGRATRGWVPRRSRTFFFSRRRRHTSYWRDWSSDVCSSDLSRLGGRQLLVLSARDLLAAAAREELLLVAFYAPAPAAIAGFARAARDAEAPLVLVRPSGAAEEKGPQEARDDIAFADAVFRAAGDVGFRGPLALLKDPPRAGSAIPDAERVQREIEAGFTGVSIAAADTQQDARDAALTAAAVCQMELGLEIVPLGGARGDAELARQLTSRGAPPSAVR